MQYILIVISLSFFIILLIDALLQFNTWQSRIKIGRFSNATLWMEKISNRSLKWLYAVPVIPVTDQKRLIVWDMIQGNYKRSAIQSWQEAALFLGLTEQAMVENNEAIKTRLKNFVTQKVTSQKTWKVVPDATDHAILAYAFLIADFIDAQQLKPAFDQTYHMILSLKGTDGTVAYKKHNPDYRFVDTVGFICPFLIHYGLKFNHPEAIDLGVHQMLEYQKYGMMTSENIPCHTYQLQSKIPSGLFGWGRGLGWWLIGLIDSWAALPKEDSRKKDLESNVIKTAISLLKFQETNGGFHWLLFDKASRLDSSTTATAAYFMKKASEIPEIEAVCISGKEKALQYLKSVTRRNGAIDFSQGDTKAIGIYSQNFDVLPFTQGFALRASY